MLDTPASPACCASAGKATTAPAMNIRNIHGEHTLENAASFLKPAIASADDHGAHDHHDEHEADVVRIPVHLRRDAERDAHGRRRHRDHAAGEDAEQHGVEQVVDDRQPRAADAAQVPVQRQARLHRDRRAQQRPGQHGQRVADRESDEHVADAGAPVDEHHADDELGGRHVLAGQRPREVAGTDEPVLGDRFAVELVERIEVLGGRRCGHGAGVYRRPSGRFGESGLGTRESGLGTRAPGTGH